MTAPESDLLLRLTGLLPGALLTTPAAIAATSPAKGAYVLLAHLAAAQELLIRGRVWPVAAGWHVYVGSARGPGGMRARLARHFRPDKAPHWHIDRLTLAADALLALAIEDGSECDIVARLAGSADFAHILPGFGSSDCRACASHLLVPLGRLAGSAD